MDNNNIIRILNNIDNKINLIGRRQEIIKNDIDGLKVNNTKNISRLKSTIPYMSGRQLTALRHRGWTDEEIHLISGLSVEDINKKISTYKDV